MRTDLADRYLSRLQQNHRVVLMRILLRRERRPELLRRLFVLVAGEIRAQAEFWTKVVR